MDGVRFDRLLRRFSTMQSRRGLAGVLGLAALGLPARAEARKKRKKRKKRKVKRNAFGCVNVGTFCKHDGQCCSGICEGKKDKKKCQAHDTADCPDGVEELFCNAAGADVECVTSDGTGGLCDTTTGYAPYCTRHGDCFFCTRDVDCVPFCGPRAACIVCPACAATNGAQTACASSSAARCSFPP